MIKQFAPFVLYAMLNIVMEAEIRAYEDLEEKVKVEDSNQFQFKKLW